jgi:hypothetical protein
MSVTGVSRDSAAGNLGLNTEKWAGQTIDAVCGDC